MNIERNYVSGQNTEHRTEAVSSIDAELRIIGINGKKVNSTKRKVWLTRLGLTKLVFKTTLWLAPAEQWRISLRFSMEDIPIEAIGQILLAEQDYHWWAYEVELGPSPYTHKLLVRALNQRLLRNSPALHRVHQAYGRHT